MTPDTASLRVAVAAARAPIQLVVALRDLDCGARVVEGGRAALDRLCAETFDCVVVEHEAHALDGFALVADLRRLARYASTPILLICPEGETGARRAALQAGANDVLVRPLDALDLHVRLRTLLALAAARREGERRVVELTALAESRERETIRRLMRAAEYRDDQLGDHLTRVAGCVIAIAEALGLPPAEAEEIALASTMHDIGKIGVRDGVLLKAGPLTAPEREEMKLHALRGFRMLDGSSSRLLRLAAQIALTHHERWDGQGYPRGLAGEAIPLAGRIVAVADVFDALTAERPYKPAWPLERARRHLQEQAGAHFDPACVAAFLTRWDDVSELVAPPADASHAA